MTNLLQDRFFAWLLIALTQAGMLASFAAGQQPAPAESDTLAGPKVVDNAKTNAKPTLMQPSFDGTMEELTERPEVALLRQLPLSEMEKAATDTLLAERTIQVNKLLAENLEEFLALQSLLQEVAGGGSPYPQPPANADDQGGMKESEAPGERPNQRPAEQRLREKMFALRDKAKDLIEPPLVDQMASHLSSENQQKLRSAVDEFYRSNPAPNSPRPGGSLAAPRSREPGVPLRPREEQRIETQQLLRELGRSLRSIVDERRSRFDELVKAVEPTPEQESKIQSILRDQGVAGQLKPTTAQRSESFRKIMDVLTPAQRQKLREALAR
jgi:hypothetical protein